MAQPGNFTPILLYGSSTPGNVPLAANLTNSATGSEIAINVADKNLFFKDSGGAVNTVPIRQSSTSSNGWLSATDWNTFNNKSNTNGTVTSVAALTLGTTGTDLSSTVANGTTTPVITLNVPTASASNRGALSAADWSTFNSKAPGVTFTSNYIPFGQGTTTLNQSAALTFDGTNFATTGNATLGGGSGAKNLTFNTGTGSYILGKLGGSNTYLIGDTVQALGSGTGFITYVYGANPILWVTGSGEAMRINASNSLLVGTTTSLQSTSTFYNASNPACAFYRPISSGGASIASFFSDVGGAATFKSYVDSAGAFTTVSDVRTKKNVEPISTGLSVVAKLRPVSFNWRYEDDALPKTNGFIAQEVELVYPEAVTTMDVSKSNGYVDQKMMKNDALLPILVKALQELNEKFDAYVASHP